MCDGFMFVSFNLYSSLDCKLHEAGVLSILFLVVTQQILIAKWLKSTIPYLL